MSSIQQLLQQQIGVMPESVQAVVRQYANNPGLDKFEIYNELVRIPTNEFQDFMNTSKKNAEGTEAESGIAVFEGMPKEDICKFLATQMEQMKRNPAVMDALSNLVNK